VAKKLYVGNLTYDTTEDNLVELFSEFGEVLSAQIIIDRDTNRSKGFGFVEMADGADEAANALNGRQGPFVEAAPQFGYQGRLPVRDILRVGIKGIDAHCQKQFSGKTFAQLEHADQETLLKAAEAGTLQLENISAKEFFTQLLNETRMGYFCDPRHGGNKNMAAWKMIGYPGMRADYTNWVEVRDQPYPLPPVDLAGKRG